MTTTLLWNSMFLVLGGKISQRGIGRGGVRQAIGGPDQCVCPKCGSSDAEVIYDHEYTYSEMAPQQE